MPPVTSWRGFRCLTGVKQGCPLNLNLFGLCVDGLETSLLETADIDAPTLMGVIMPLLLYADDLILMSECIGTSKAA